MDKESDQKLSAQHVEELAPGDDYVDTQLSGYEDLGVGATLKRFKFATFICILVTFSAASDGYQVSHLSNLSDISANLLNHLTKIGMNGNIIANTGFIRQFATETDADGNPVLAAGVLATWGPIMSVGQFIGMTTLPL